MRRSGLRPPDLLVLAGWTELPAVAERLTMLDLGDNPELGGSRILARDDAEIELFGLEAMTVALAGSAVRTLRLDRAGDFGLGGAAITQLSLGFGGSVPLAELDISGIKLGTEAKGALGRALGRIDMQRLRIDLGRYHGDRPLRLVCRRAEFTSRS
jgi:hypothetical protein